MTALSTLSPPTDSQRAPLTTKDGWLDYCATATPARPPGHDLCALTALRPAARTSYDEARHAWHANPGPFRTPAWDQVHAELDAVLGSNRQSRGTVRPSVAVDGDAGLGKSTALQRYIKRHHNAVVTAHGPEVTAGVTRLPVCYVTLTSEVTPRGLNAMLCDFYALPMSGSAQLLGQRVTRAVLTHGTELLVLDDIHFVNARNRTGEALNNHMKHLASVLPATLVVAGIDLESTGLLPRVNGRRAGAAGQTGRRWTVVPVSPYDTATDAGAREWRGLLLAMEQHVVLATTVNKGFLADDLAEYLFDRTQGVLVSLISLLTRACHRAITTGEERLSRDLFDAVRVDHESESRRTHVSLPDAPARPARRRRAA